MKSHRSGTLGSRLARLDWHALHASMDEAGFAVTPPLLNRAECDDLISIYQDDHRFRRHIVMQRHGYGHGDYKYFTHPLPAPVAALRQDLYRGLAPLANRWASALGEGREYPPTLEEYLDICHGAGQARPTPLILRYTDGDYNRLHQDLYGEHRFPLQATFLLSDTGTFEGGEFLLVENRARMQSRAEVVPLARGTGVLFPVHHRPLQGKRGFVRATMRHGVSRVRRGERFTLGIIFHDAK